MGDNLPRVSSPRGRSISRVLLSCLQRDVCYSRTELIRDLVPIFRTPVVITAVQYCSTGLKACCLSAWCFFLLLVTDRQTLCLYMTRLVFLINPADVGGDVPFTLVPCTYWYFRLLLPHANEPWYPSLVFRPINGFNAPAYIYIRLLCCHHVCCSSPWWACCGQSILHVRRGGGES